MRKIGPQCARCAGDMRVVLCSYCLVPRLPIRIPCASPLHVPCAGLRTRGSRKYWQGSVTFWVLKLKFSPFVRLQSLRRACVRPCARLGSLERCARFTTTDCFANRPPKHLTRTRQKEQPSYMLSNPCCGQWRPGSLAWKVVGFRV